MDASDSEAGFGFAGLKGRGTAGAIVYDCCKMYPLPVAVLFAVLVEDDIESGKAGE